MKRKSGCRVEQRSAVSGVLADPGTVQEESNQMRLTKRIITVVAGFSLSCGMLFPAFPQTLGEALNAPDLPWSTDADLPWSPTGDAAHDGSVSVTSGTIGINQTNWLQTTITGPKALGFWWKVSSASGGGSSYLSLVVAGRMQGRAAGLTDWQWRSFYVPPGPQTVRWFFGQKVTNGLARGWIDEVSLSDAIWPEILAHPTNQTVSAGTPVTLVAAVGGAEPWSLQWQRFGVGITDATNSSFALTNPQARDAGDYTLVLTNPAGAITSRVATLTVLGAKPAFTIAPASQGAPLGASITLTAAAAGTEPLGWQWYSNGIPVSSLTSTSLVVKNVRDAAYGTYWAIVTNSMGAATSSVARLSFSPIVYWGSKSYGMDIVPPSATNIVSFSGGDFHVVALRRDGSIVGWGGNFLGLTGAPPSATNVVGIASGNRQNMVSTLR